jgi:branched-subunit amino acid ABC-type transport system permease component
MAAQIIANSIIIGCVYAVIAFGFTLMYSTMNFFNMAYGATVLVGAYTFYVFYHTLGWPILISATLSCAITSGFMLAIDRICYYKMRQRRVPSWSIVVISMAVALIIESAITIIFGARTLTVYEGFPDGFLVLGAHITTIQVAVLCSAVLIMVATTLFLRLTRTGKIIRALANDKQMATVIGIDVEQMYRIILIVGTTLATVAAVLLAMDTDIRPKMSGPVLLKAIICSVVGGVGNFTGALVAGLVLGLLESLTTLWLGSGWRDAVSLLILVILMLAKPSYFGIQTTEM